MQTKTAHSRRGFMAAQAAMLAVVACLALTAGPVRAALPEGLAAYYRFNASSGLTAVDETGAHPGTLTGALDWVPGVEGNALQFRGGNGSPFVNLGAWQTTGPAGLSVALWVKWAGPNTLYQGLICQRQDSMYWWVEISTDSAQLRFKSNTNPQSNQYLTTPHLIRDEWMHVAFSHDAAARTGVIYFDGAEKKSGTWALPSGSFANQRAGIGVVSTANGLGTFNGTIDEAMIFNIPLSAMQVQSAMKGFEQPVATDPRPADGQVDVPSDTDLAWTAHKLAATHDVYFGDSLADVGAATRTGAPGVLAGLGLPDTRFDLPGRLEFGKTYYWRVDEVNAAPDFTVFKGEVWSFAVEPYSYPVGNVTATASSISTPDMNAQKTIDGSGTTGDLHGTTPTDMWLSNTGGAPAWIQYAFDRAYKLDQMRVWNSNQVMEIFLGLGAKAVTVEYSPDGTSWTALGDFEFARAPAANNYAANTTVDFRGAVAQAVKLTIRSNWGGVLPQYGLSEVRFYHIPVAARAPSPAAGASEVAPQVTLSWRAGREAGSHQVFLGTDPGNPPLVATAATHSWETELNLDQTYYWKVVEVNEARNPAAWASEAWSFSTAKFLVVDDFESYTDHMESGEAIFQTWSDGFDSPTNGSQVGHTNPPYAEQTVVRNGRQAMLLTYSNTAGATYSEAERTFDPPQDWTRYGCQTLSLSFYGDPNDTGQMYVKINGTKIPYSGKAEDLKKPQWQPWNVDLVSTGVNFRDVTRLTIGLDGTGAAGVLYLDDLRLYPATKP